LSARAASGLVATATENNCTSEFDSPLAYRYEETANMLLCKEVKAPWDFAVCSNPQTSLFI